jgi:hypothetical protein
MVAKGGTDMTERATAKQVIDHAITTYINHIDLTPEMLKQTVGGLNGMDMDTYNKGYTDALKQLIDFFKSRV